MASIPNKRANRNSGPYAPVAVAAKYLYRRINAGTINADDPDTRDRAAIVAEFLHGIADHDYATRLSGFLADGGPTADSIRAQMRHTIALAYPAARHHSWCDTTECTAGTDAVNGRPIFTHSSTPLTVTGDSGVDGHPAVITVSAESMPRQDGEQPAGVGDEPHIYLNPSGSAMLTAEEALQLAANIVFTATALRRGRRIDELADRVRRARSGLVAGSELADTAFVDAVQAVLDDEVLTGAEKLSVLGEAQGVTR